MGSFGGTYFRPIKSSVTGKTYRDQWKEFPDGKLEIALILRCSMSWDTKRCNILVCICAWSVFVFPFVLRTSILVLVPLLSCSFHRSRVLTQVHTECPFSCCFLVKLTHSNNLAVLSTDWFEGMDVKRQIANPTYLNSVNMYGVHCGGDLNMWESSGWIK